MRYLKTFEELDPKTYIDAAMDLDQLGFEDRAHKLKSHAIGRYFIDLYNKLEFEELNIDDYEYGEEDFDYAFRLSHDDIEYISYYENYPSRELFIHIKIANFFYEVSLNYSVEDIGTFIEDFLNDNYEVYLSPLTIYILDTDGSVFEKYIIPSSANEELEVDTYMDASDELMDKGYYTRSMALRSHAKDMFFKNLFNRTTLKYYPDSNTYFIIVTENDWCIDYHKDVDTGYRYLDISHIIFGFYVDTIGVDDIDTMYEGVIKYIKDYYNIDVKVDKFVALYDSGYSFDELTINEELSNRTYMNASDKLNTLGYENRADEMRYYVVKDFYKNLKDISYISYTNNTEFVLRNSETDEDYITYYSLDNSGFYGDYSLYILEASDYIVNYYDLFDAVTTYSIYKDIIRFFKEFYNKELEVSVFYLMVDGGIYDEYHIDEE